MSGRCSARSWTNARNAKPIRRFTCFANASPRRRKVGQADAHTKQRLADMLDFFELMTTWYDSTRKMPTAAVLKMCKLGDKVAKLLGVGT